MNSTTLVAGTPFPTASLNRVMTPYLVIRHSMVSLHEATATLVLSYATESWGLWEEDIVRAWNYVIQVPMGVPPRVFLELLELAPESPAVIAVRGCLNQAAVREEIPVRGARVVDGVVPNLFRRAALQAGVLPISSTLRQLNCPRRFSLVAGTAEVVVLEEVEHTRAVRLLYQANRERSRGRRRHYFLMIPELGNQLEMGLSVSLQNGDTSITVLEDESWTQPQGNGMTATPVLMRMIIWNGRGTGSPEFRRSFLELRRIHRPSLMVVVETRLSEARAVSVSTSLGFDSVFRVDAEGFAGGLWMLWNADEVTVEMLPSSSQSIHATIRGSRR